MTIVVVTIVVVTIVVVTIVVVNIVVVGSKNLCDFIPTLVNFATIYIYNHNNRDKIAG